MKRQLLLIVTIVSATLVFQGCKGGEKEQTEQFTQDELAGRVDDWVVSKEQVQQAIDQMPDYQKQEYNTDAGRGEVTDALIQEQLFYREAERLKLGDQEQVQKQIDEARRRILIAAYYKQYVESEARPTEEEIHDYYETNQDRYMLLAVGRGQHIFSKSAEKLEDIKRRVLEGGEKFTTMAHRYSEDDLTRGDGGDLGYFNPGGYVRGFGYNHAISDSLFAMEVGKIYGPLKWEKGYSLIRVNEKRPAQLRPYAEVRPEIEQALIQQQIEDAKARVTDEIKKGYQVENYLEQYYLSRQRSPKELFEVAQTATDPNVKISAYKEVVDKFPDDEYAPKALFMVGFVYAEELKDYLQADRTFASVLSKYPDSDVADQAKWMMENLQDGTPNFDEIEKKINDD